MKKLLAWSYTIAPSFHREGLKLLPHFFKFDTDVIKRFLAHLFEYHALKLKKKTQVACNGVKVILNIVI